MLLPNQIQDLAVILNTDAETLEQVYTTADIDITDEMAILDILSDKIDTDDFGKVKTILQNYPEFDNILYKMNIVEQVLTIDKLEKVNIAENITPEVLKSFENTPLYNILSESKGETLEETNKIIRNKIMEAITPKPFLKPIMEGVEVSREQKTLLESLSRYDMDLPRDMLIRKIRELHRYMSSLPHYNGKVNSQYIKCGEELRELEALYDKKFGTLTEDMCEPIKPIAPIEPIEPEEEKKLDKDGKPLKTNDETDVMNMNDEEANEEIEDMLDANIDIDPILLKRAFGDINADELKNLYKDMDSEELQDHLEAIDEYLK